MIKNNKTLSDKISPGRPVLMRDVKPIPFYEIRNTGWLPPNTVALTINSPQQAQAIANWLNENCTGELYVGYISWNVEGFIIFEKDEDAMAFKLRWT